MVFTQQPIRFYAETFDKCNTFIVVDYISARKSVLTDEVSIFGVFSTFEKAIDAIKSFDASYLDREEFIESDTLVVRNSTVVGRDVITDLVKHYIRIIAFELDSGLVL